MLKIVPIAVKQISWNLLKFCEKENIKQAHFFELTWGEYACKAKFRIAAANTVEDGISKF